ncbi:MAG: exopolysaccharide biosynthesis polyprenyl glycosylphosphotransferase [Solirubrobacteraceae bacterium]
MSALPRPAFADDALADAVGAPTMDIVRGRRAGTRLRRRGWVVRRALLTADLAALVVAFLAAELLFGAQALRSEWPTLVVILPAWILVAEVYGLYERDEERAGHTTVDDLPAVFHVVTLGVWLLLLGGLATGIVMPELQKLAAFWLLAIGLVCAARGLARARARRSVHYVQNMLIVGAGEVGQLVARKVLQHPEYGINVVGFVDDDPRELRADVAGVAHLGGHECLSSAVELFDVDRVVIAFSRDDADQTVELVRTLHEADVQIDVVPRLFDVLGLNVAYHGIEALPLIGVPPVRPARSSRVVKRVIDVVGASIALVATAPLFAVIAVLVRRDSPGPILFRQTRLGLGMTEFTALKFRTMCVDADDSAHRAYIRDTMSAQAEVGANGVYKLDRGDQITRVGRVLRATSLDELPQLINVLRGDMSLVGPRPCIPYETENFRPHHFGRFTVPAGITGLWQVTARANSTFGEALDMDVAYARGWSLGLDLRLLALTPLQVLRQKGTA